MESSKEAFFVYFGLEQDSNSITENNFWQEFLINFLYPDCLFINSEGLKITISIAGFELVEKFINFCKFKNKQVDFELSKINLLEHYECDIDDFDYYRFDVSDNYDVYELVQY